MHQLEWALMLVEDSYELCGNQQQGWMWGWVWRAQGAIINLSQHQVA